MDNSVRKRFAKLTVVLMLALAILIVGLSTPFIDFPTLSAAPVLGKLGTFSEKELKMYDGYSPKRPVFIAIDGYVYNVGRDRKLYSPGGANHIFTGKNLKASVYIGGEITKDRYPLVGVLVD